MNITSNNASNNALNLYYKNQVNITGYSTIKCLLDLNVYVSSYGIALSMNNTVLTNLSAWNPYTYSKVLNVSNTNYILELDISNITDGNYYIGFNLNRSNAQIKAIWLE
ncbi:hypothetical protein D3C72_1498470 [compost metagenome]